MSLDHLPCAFSSIYVITYGRHPSSSADATTTHTVTSTVIVRPSLRTAPRTSFLQNRVASGLVFTVVGTMGLALIIFVAIFRRRRNRKLLEDSEAVQPVPFDPVVVEGSSIGNGIIGPEMEHRSKFGSHCNPASVTYPPPMGHAGPYPVHMFSQSSGSASSSDDTNARLPPYSLFDTLHKGSGGSWLDISLLA